MLARIKPKQYLTIKKIIMFHIEYGSRFICNVKQMKSWVYSQPKVYENKYKVTQVF